MGVETGRKLPESGRHTPHFDLKIKAYYSSVTRACDTGIIGVITGIPTAYTAVYGQWIQNVSFTSAF